MSGRAGAVVTAVAVLIVTFAVGAGPSQAAGPGAVTGSWGLGYRNTFSTARVGLGAVWVARTDEYQSTVITRLDPSAATSQRVAELRFASGGFAVGAGSLWVTDWFGNAVWRLAPDGTVQARIPTGSGPQDVEWAFGSIWVADHHAHGVTRIDPGTDGVVATVTAGDPERFRNGPGAMVAGLGRLWVVSDIDVGQVVDPATDRVTGVALAPDLWCTPNLTAGYGAVWIPDQCTDTVYAHRLDGAVAVRVAYTAPAAPTQIAVLGASVWTGVDRQFDQDTLIGSHGVLEQRDPATGRLVRTVVLGGDVGEVVAGSGVLWVVDNAAGVVRRVDPSLAGSRSAARAGASGGSVNARGR